MTRHPARLTEEQVAQRVRGVEASIGDPAGPILQLSDKTYYLDWSARRARTTCAPARGSRTARSCKATCKPNGQPRRCRRANFRRASQRSSNRGGRQGSAPQATKGSAHTAATATLPSSLRSHGRRLLNGLRRAALHLLRALRCPASSKGRSTSLGRPMICGGGCPGPDWATHLGGRT